MVDAVVSFVVERLGELLIEQVGILRGVKDEVKLLREKLGRMLAFLEDAEEKQYQDHRVRQWVSDVRDLAYDAEDIIEDFILQVKEGEGTSIPSKKLGLKDYFQKYLCICSKHASIIEETKNRYRIGGEIEKWKERLVEIERDKETFNIIDTSDGRKGSDLRDERLNPLRRGMPFDNNELVVGFHEDAEKLRSELVKSVKHLGVISIWGMGGLGKTTIARKLYNDNSLRDKFDRYAWVSVSNNYVIRDLLQKIIKSFEGPPTKDLLEDLEKMDEVDLASHLRCHLEGHRYLVVIDDVWHVDAWKSLRSAFPDNKNGSRVIVTTRHKNVAEQFYKTLVLYVHELPFLKAKESWELFSKIAFPNDDEVEDKKKLPPPNLERSAREMVSKCRGLPLAIVVLGGLLCGKDSYEWSKLKDKIWHHITEEDSDHVKHILELSFNNLSPHLKSCFLYLGLFPEDYAIDVERLCWLWEAEGFVKQGDEPLAYLQKLIDRSLILVSERYWRRIVTCRVHDLVRDLAIQKSKEMNFLDIYDGTNHSLVSPNSRRRLASHCGFQRFISLDRSEVHLRTLLFFNCLSEQFGLEVAKLQPLCMKLRLLRVLDLEELSFCVVDPDLETWGVSLPDEIGKLIHLRYLGLHNVDCVQLPPSIGNLHALQTLELTSFPLFGIVQLPDEIRNAKQLRHLVGCFKWPFPVDNLTELQTLRSVVVEASLNFEPTSLTSLRELSVVTSGRDKRFTLDFVSGLRSLQALEVSFLKEFIGMEVSPAQACAVKVDVPTFQPLSQCEKLIQMKLAVDGAWTFPADFHQFPPNLKFLLLDGEFTEDPFPVLEKLPNLTLLGLKYRGVGGNKLVCSAQGFPLLEILHVFRPSSEELEVEVEVEEGGMPMLKGLGLEGLGLSATSQRLSSIPHSGPFSEFGWPY